jgi:hypothetical protein
MENTFDLKKFLVENKLTTNSRMLSEVDQFVQIANNLKKIKTTAEAVLRNAERALQDEDTYAGIDRVRLRNPQAVEQQIEVVQDILENIEDYAGDGWAVDIEDVAREKSIPELQMMLKRLIEETDNLQKELTGQPIQEGDLNEGWKQWALGALAGLSVLGGGTAQAATYNTVDTNQPGIEMTTQQANTDRAWESIKSDLKSTNPMLIISKDYTTELPFQSLNWGTTSNKNTGERGAIGVVYTKGSKTVDLDFFSDTNPEVISKLTENAKEAGISLSFFYNGAQAKIPVDQVSKIVNFIKTSLPMLKGAPRQKVGLKVGGNYDVGSNTGPMEPGPVDKPDGSVYIGGKRITR